MIHLVSYPHDRITCSAATLFNEMLADYDVKHSNGFGNLPLDAKGAVVVFHGQQDAQKPNIGKRLSQYARELEWVIFVSLGDEGCDFPYGDLDHPRMKLWVQTPKPGKVTADRYLIEGYHPNTRALLAKIPDYDRTLDWFFAGQVNHERRQSCFEAIREVRVDWNGLSIPTAGFMQGVPLADYYAYMKEAKIILCPAGPLTPDSFRFAEALEAGCIPILDAYSPDHVPGYWSMVLGLHPFPVIEDWNKLPEMMAVVLDHHEAMQEFLQSWWSEYKRKFRTWLRQDLEGI
jgi:hypothetical protein